MNLRHGHLLGDGLRHGRPVAGEERDGGHAQRPQVREHLGRFRAELVAGADHAENLAVRGHEERRLPRGVEAVEGLGGCGRNGDPLFFEKPPRADHNRFTARGRRHAPAGVGAEVRDLNQ